MTFLFDILHPAHVHFFRNLIAGLNARGLRTIVTARGKEISFQLLDQYAIPYTAISNQRNGLGLIGEMIVRTIRLIRICQKEKPAMLAGIMGPSIAVAGKLLGIPAWVFYDTENAWITNWFAYPLAARVYTPSCYTGKVRGNHKTYQGYHELAYLHPSRFSPNAATVRSYGIDPLQPYSLVRFVGWQASHDLGEQGLSLADKIRLVETLEKFGPVHISSESPLPAELDNRRIKIAITDIHHLIAFARLVVGESATMASEAAVLGVPAIFISDTSRGYTLEQEKDYQLVFNMPRAQIDKAILLVNYVLTNPDSGVKYALKRQDLLNEKIDVTAYILNEIETVFGLENH